MSDAFKITKNRADFILFIVIAVWVSVVVVGHFPKERIIQKYVNIQDLLSALLHS